VERSLGLEVDEVLGDDIGQDQRVGQFVAGGKSRSVPKEVDRTEADDADLEGKGERRFDAERLLDRVKQASPNVTTTQTLIGEMLRMRTVRV